MSDKMRGESKRTTTVVKYKQSEKKKSKKFHVVNLCGWTNEREREKFYVCIKHKILEMERDNIKRNTKQNQMKSYKPNKLECSDGKKQRPWKKSETDSALKIKMQNAKYKL